MNCAEGLHFSAFILILSLACYDSFFIQVGTHNTYGYKDVFNLNIYFNISAKLCREFVLIVLFIEMVGPQGVMMT